MLTAWDIERECVLALPDYEEVAELAAMREWARAGRVVCPVCREKLLLRAGEKRCVHLAHRVLADCPHAHVSVAIIETRRLLYRFFQDRIQRGKLIGPIELESNVPGLSDGTCIDLILRREARPPVAIVLLEAGLKPDPRWMLSSIVQEQNFVFRPVFLVSTLKPKKETAGVFLLNPTQRDMTHKSLFGLSEDDYGMRDALHFVDYERAQWTSLRGLHLEHPPQVYGTESVRHSPMSELLWSESQAEWTHPGESRAKIAAPPAIVPAFTPPQRHQAISRSVTAPHPAQPQPKYEPAAWITGGLVCIGCQVRTNDWSMATPGSDGCVCKTCFAKGIR